MNKKIILIFIFFILTILLLLLVYNEQKVPVLGYHSFYKYESELKEENPEFINNIKEFEKQMKYLKKHNYKTLTLDEFYCWKKGECKIPRKSVVITMDDGNLSNYMYAFPILKKYGFKASVFFVGVNSKYFGKSKGDIYDVMSFEVIEKCKKEYPNIKFYPHSYNLHGKISSDFSYEELQNDINNLKDLGDYDYYAYPFGSYDDRMIKLLKENNYKLAFAFGPKKEFRKARKSDDDYKIPRLNISNYVSMKKFKLRLNFLY